MRNNGRNMKFYQNRYTKTQLKKLLARIEEEIYHPVADLEITAWKTKEPVIYDKRTSGEQLKLKVGDRWGDLFDCAWFCFQGEIPESAAGRKVVLMIDVSGEALVVDADGYPAQCLTTAKSIFDRSLGRPGKNIVILKGRARGVEKVELWADIGNNDLFGTLQNDGKIQQAHVATCNEPMRMLYYDYEVLFNLLEQLPENSARYQRILYALYRAAIRLNNFSEKEAEAARLELAPELAKQNGDYSLRFSAIGHSHLDLAWLWPIRETIRKGARTFSNVLMLMDQYPDFKFGASQAQLYQWIKDHYPELYSRVKNKIIEGRWDLLGATWVEPDTNIIGGEAFIRQFLYGKKFFKQEFGQDIKVLFLPDSFGYTGALPQIMKKCGVDYFVTIKLSWDRFNIYPHHSFLWRGIDGSEVLVHMPPEGTYNSSASPQAIMSAEKAYLDKAVSEDCLVVYGIGDGGGGPGFEHLERLQREKNLEGLAPVTQEKVLAFFNRLEKDKNKFHTWIGELYLGMHQGTYTTQGRNKRYNRKLELALRDLEFLSVLSNLSAKTSYPQKQIEKIWKELLLYQFHDILPGSSITRVFDECLERYAKLAQEIAELTERMGSALVQKIDTSKLTEPILIMNSLSWERRAWFKIDNDWYWIDAPPLGFIAIDQKKPATKFPQLIAESNLLENEFLQVRFDENGNICSIWDKENQRPVLQPGASANLLTVYFDDGDAWDFSVDYEYRIAGYFELQSTEIMIDGPKVILKQIRQFGQSRLIQNIILTSGSRRLDFETKVEWNERNKMLRASFPIDVHTTESVSDIQFGHIKRPNHQNTSWEKAKFEICAHKWIDLSQPDYGVALLNDSKYGHKAVGNVLDIDLLRSPQNPDPRADQAVHEFTYSLFPHAGNHLSGGVIKVGYELNVPLKALNIETNQGSGTLPSRFSLISVDVENVVIESIKKSEDRDDFIFRLYEAFGMANSAGVKLGFPIKAACLTNMLEEHIADLVFKTDSLILDFKPFEIKTIRLTAEKW